MAVCGGSSVVEIDKLSSESGEPHGIITVDCSNPHEIDDGISVAPLPADQETYRVRVFAVDTSPLYYDGSIIRRVLRRTESVYHNSRTSVETYEPMLEDHHVRKRHFIQNTVRSALVISFVVGKDQPPEDFEVTFGRAETRRNYNYAQFDARTLEDEAFMPYSRAASFIINHLQADNDGAFESTRRADSVSDPADESFRRGANLVQAFMVAANHIVARVMRDEDRLAIYRVHDTQNDAFTEIIPPNIARYSVTPGPHDGLGLDAYTRVTSPLRRAEDFIMLGLLKARHEGQELRDKDRKNVAAAVQRLNQRVVTQVHNGTLRLRDEDLWVADLSR